MQRPPPARGSGSVRKPSVAARSPANSPAGTISGRNTSTTCGCQARPAASIRSASPSSRNSKKRVASRGASCVERARLEERRLADEREPQRAPPASGRRARIVAAASSGGGDRPIGRGRLRYAPPPADARLAGAHHPRDRAGDPRRARAALCAARADRATRAPRGATSAAARASRGRAASATRLRGARAAGGRRRGRRRAGARERGRRDARRR